VCPSCLTSPVSDSFLFGCVLLFSQPIIILLLAEGLGSWGRWWGGKWKQGGTSSIVWSRLYIFSLGFKSRFLVNMWNVQSGTTFLMIMRYSMVGTHQTSQIWVCSEAKLLYLSLKIHWLQALRGVVSRVVDKWGDRVKGQCIFGLKQFKGI
jgi:hypothetical protein